MIGIKDKIKKLPFYYGWAMLMFAGISIFFTGSGQTYTFTFFFKVYVEELGWSSTLVSTLYTTATIISGLTMFLVGRLVDRVGAKKIAIAAALLLGLASMFHSFVTMPMMLFAGFFFSRFSGQGTLGITAGTYAPRWFVKKRAMAMMLAGLGGTVGGFVYPLLNQYLISTIGWRWAWRVLGLSIWVIYVPIAMIFIFNKPEDVGLNPDGIKDEDIKNSDINVLNEVSFTQKQAVSTWAFWLIAYCSLQMGAIGTGITLHFSTIFSSYGFVDKFAAQILSIQAPIAFTAMLVAGMFMDKLKKPQLVLTLGCLLQGIGYVFLAAMPGEWAAYAYAATVGIANSLAMFSISVLRPKMFGRKFIGSIAGAFAVVGVIGTGLGPMPFGIAYDYFGNYTNILWISVIFPVVAVIASLFIKKPHLPSRITE